MLARMLTTRHGVKEESMASLQTSRGCSSDMTNDQTQAALAYLSSTSIFSMRLKSQLTPTMSLVARQALLANVYLLTP